jgi:branched-chain amino acid transport system permease protein
VRAATQDREMVGALGVNQAWLFTAVFALGRCWPAWAARCSCRASRPPGDGPEHHRRRLRGGGGGRHGLDPGAFAAALLIAEIKAVCIWLGVVELFGFDVSFSKLTLVVEFLVMAVVLVVRPWGLMGKPQAAPPRGLPERRCAPGRWCKLGGGLLLALLVLLPWLTAIRPICGAGHRPAGSPPCLPPACTSSWGRPACIPSVTRPTSAWGPTRRRCWCARPAADGGALLLAPLAAAAGALLYGWFCVRLSGVYLAMLTLAFAQITWAISTSGTTSPAAATA